MGKFKQVWNCQKGHPVLKKIDKNEKWDFNFGEHIGMLAFGQWFPAIRMGHPCYSGTFKFPLRIKFVENPYPPEGTTPNQIIKLRGWNLKEWVKAAQELEEEGVRAIVTGCGMTGTIQRELADSVNIPVFTSTVQFIPQIYHSLKNEKKIGIVTVSSKILTRWDNMLLQSCGVDLSIPMIIEGMTESEFCDIWWTQLEKDYNTREVEEALFRVTDKMLTRCPDIGAIIYECTEMPLYTNLIRKRIKLPIFDANDMIRFAYNLVSIDNFNTLHE